MADDEQTHAPEDVPVPPEGAALPAGTSAEAAAEQRPHAMGGAAGDGGRGDRAGEDAAADEADEESFPASDAPGSWAGPAT